MTFSVSECSVVVNVASDADADEWDAALSHLTGATFHHRFGWRTINKEAFGHRPVFLVARKHGRIAGLLPLTLVSSRLFGRILCSMPFANLGGPCAEDATISHRLLEKAKEISLECAADYLELRCRSQLDCDWPVSLRKTSMVVPLQAVPEQVFATFTPKHRNNIRRAQKNKLVVESGGRALLSEFYHVMERSWRDLGTPFYAHDYFERIMTTFPHDTRIFMCRRHGKAIATAFNGYFDGTVEGLWNGGVAEARALGANYVLYWEMIRDACLRGFSWFQLGRSTADSGAEEFKRKWNSEKHQLYSYYWRLDGQPDASLERR